MDKPKGKKKGRFADKRSDKMDGLLRKLCSEPDGFHQGARVEWSDVRMDEEGRARVRKYYAKVREDIASAAGGGKLAEAA